MALQDPNAPFAPSPAYWDDEMQRQYEEQMGGAQQFGDPTAPLVGTIFDIPKTLTPPDPQMPVEKAPRTVNGIPVPEAYDETESRGGATPRTLDNDRGRYVDPTTGDTMFPLGDRPAPQPRGDNARIGAFGQPLADEVPLSAQALSPDEEAQIEIDPPSFVDPYSVFNSIRPPWEPQAQEQQTAPSRDQGRPDFLIGAVDDEGNMHRAWRGDAETSLIEMPDELAGDPLKADDEKLAVDALTNEDPETFAKRLVDRRTLEDTFKREQMLTVSKQREQRAQEELEDVRQLREDDAKARREIEDEGRQLAATTVDPDHWWGSRSTPQKIAAILSAFIGGFAMNKTGRNIGLEQIDAAIREDIEAQKATLSNRLGALGQRRSALADAFERTQDINRAEAVAYEAAWQSAVGLIDMKAADLDPQGRRRLLAAQARREAIAMMDAARRKAAEAAAKAMLEQRKQERDDFKVIEEQRHNMQAERNDRTRAGADWKRATTDAMKTEAEIAQARRDNQPRSIDYWKATYPDNPTPPHEMSQKEYDAFVSRSGKGADARASQANAQIKETEARVAKSGPGGSPYALADQDGNAYVKKDGAVFEIKDDTRRYRAHELNTFGQNMRRAADLVDIMHRKYGGASKALGSPEAQELTNIMAMTDFETYKGFGLGAPSAGDKQMAADARGGKDITSFVFDATPGFKAYAKGAEEKFNTEMRTNGYDGGYIKFKRIEAAEATERTDSQNIDVYNAPTIHNESVPLEIRRRDAVRAAEAAPALTRQLTAASDVPYLKSMAERNAQRLQAGLIDKEQALDVHKAVRKATRKALTAKLLEMPPFERTKYLSNAGGTPLVGVTDDVADRELGVDLNTED